MDAIQFNTPDFVITIHADGKVIAQVTLTDWCPDPAGFTPEDISNTSLGKLLWAACQGKFGVKQ